ncbi:hypothetical protein NDN08_000342 [Rhodosorus marinus]|uniref:HTH myb-type domain-containing protein n=1 Tax=Rhodosorus marinus TaxID=101924 RepID=A0AAV8UMY1_9RHOD|nr:hypothetical protein NDN08_000342 [Rhodosorus marinus]
MEELKVEIGVLRERNALLEADLELAREEIVGLRQKMSGITSEPAQEGSNSESTAAVGSQLNTSLSSQRESEEPAKRTRKRKDRSAAAEPGQSRYWTSQEHKLFLEALRVYGHKDLKNIAQYVGTRNMTQVRTHAQKYFMRLMKEAKRLNDTNENVPKNEVGGPAESEEKKTSEEVRSVPADCGVSLLSLVAQETCLV